MRARICCYYSAVKKTSPAKSSPSKSQLRNTIANLREEFADKLAALVGIPSVSMEPGRHAEVRGCAELACAYLREAGAKAEVIATQGLPLVFGRLI